MNETAPEQTPTETIDPRWIDENGEVIDEDHRGLVYDIGVLINRRAALGVFGAIGVGALLAACAPTTQAASTSTPSASATTTPTPTATATPSPSATMDAPVAETPNETEGPYPGDGSNGVDVLAESGVVRSDIRSGFGAAASTTAEGVPLTFSIIVRDAATGAAMSGAGVYVWHCDRNGDYSLYSSGLENVNYLRGVQATDASGTATFTSIFPACYSGRWPHIHFEIYQNAASAVSDGPIVKTSQIALPEDACAAVYATSGYEQSVRNLAQVSLATDNVFGDDGGVHQIATMTGDATSGYTATLTVGV